MILEQVRDAALGGNIERGNNQVAEADGSQESDDGESGLQTRQPAVFGLFSVAEPDPQQNGDGREFDTELLMNHIEALREGESIELPIYDYATHSRRPETTHIEPRPVIIIEGILAFANPQMRALMDMKIFVDTDPDIRFIRRLDRDVHERGRSVESIISQYTTTVRPMHLQFVEPSKRYADIIIPEGGYNDVGMDLITCKLRSILAASAAGDEIPIHSDAGNGSDRSQVRG